MGNFFLFVMLTFVLCFAISSCEQKQKYHVAENDNFLHMHCLVFVVIAYVIIRRKKKKKRKNPLN